MSKMANNVDPEFAFFSGAEAMRSHIAAWAMSKGLTPVAIDILSMPRPRFSLPEVMTLASAPACNCHMHKSGESTGGWICQVHGQRL